MANHLSRDARGKGENWRTAGRRPMQASIAGPFFYRRWFSWEPIDEPFAESVVQDFIDRATGR